MTKDYLTQGIYNGNFKPVETRFPSRIICFWTATVLIISCCGAILTAEVPGENVIAQPNSLAKDSAAASLPFAWEVSQRAHPWLENCDYPMRQVVIAGEPGIAGAKPWKWDVDVCDLPEWNCFTWNFPNGGAIQKRDGNQIVIRFDAVRLGVIGTSGDFYYEHYRQCVLSSKDCGLTWEWVEPDWKYNIPLKLSDGTLVEIVCSHRLRSREEQKARLEKLGIGHIWRDDCELFWEIWPASMAKELSEKGLYVWDGREASSLNESSALPTGTVATHVPEFVCRRSSDDGRTWSESTIRNAPGEEKPSFVCCGWAGACVLPDDTILVPCYRRSPGNPERAFVLRSEDRGKTWQAVEITGTGRVDETWLVYHPSGRVIALMRGGIFESHSDDGGRSWTTPKYTGMRGLPLSAICLRSGNILCTYANRKTLSGGVRATLSYDRGDSWDTKNTKMIRRGYATGGPGSVQLDDGTIFTFCSFAREIGAGYWVDGYIVGSRYTEDYVGTIWKEGKL